MKTLVIYDSTGRIWNIVYGAKEAPQGLTCMWVDIPDGAQLESIDVTNKDEPKAVFTYLPESDIGRLQTKVTELEAKLAASSSTLAEQYEANIALQTEVTNTQLALTEIYEAKGV